ncbi:sugar transferase [Rubellimicrobium aerolatum]|uniref:Sugar transferase n=1 Tax=Rubellimicrobium aerolatum TaxID=490979 RepID=A0ABW0SE97_9RHOB|nr:sugar transferase [Rubellimicrobium aerolatum]MBP1806813.1 lipopolysaccharide/colanic/teichoic acid biosynthesis glycosyltransferase [Rubellimicrobium aerolatum]
MTSFDSESMELTSATALALRRRPGRLGERLRASPAPAAAALAAADLSVFAATVLGLAALGWPGLDTVLALRFALLTGAFAIAQFVGAGLYPGYGLYEYEQARRRAAVVLRTLAVALGIAAVATPEWRPIAATVPVILLASLLQVAGQGAVARALHRHGFWGQRVAVVAPEGVAPAVVASLRANWRHGLIPALPAEMRARPPAMAVVAGPMPEARTVQALLRAHDTVLLLADTPDLRISGLQPARLGGRVGLVLGARAEGPGLVRRLADLLIAIPMLVLAAPIIAMAALAIRLIDPGPVLYRQEREGHDGRVVRVLKLRTMYRDAERRLEALLATDPARQAEWEAHYKLRDDPRILPKVGRFLRSSSLDELPQLFNVLGGSMSLVGPRPFPIYHLAAMDPEFRAKRRTVVPGLTGLWQVSDRSEADIARQQQLDEFYIDNQSFWFDGHILLRTVHAVFGRGGAY